MKITKEMLAELRAAVLAEMRAFITGFEPTSAAPVRTKVILALLDERKALREALKVCVPVGPSSKERRDLALLGGEDEQ